VLHKFGPDFSVQTVQVYLEESHRILNVSFDATIHIPGSETITKSGERGSVMFKMPGNIATIADMSIECAGYEVASNPPYQIDGGIVHVEVRPARLPPPANAEAYPSEQAIVDMPTRQDVAKQPAVDPTSVTFQYKNLTASKLRLVFLSCSAYYKNRDAKSDEPEQPSGYWCDWDFPPVDEFETFDRFSEESTGWYCFFVATVDPANNRRQFYFLGNWNLFESQTPVLIVRKSRDAKKPYQAEFRKSENE
jgi:hypothetical protein